MIQKISSYAKFVAAIVGAIATAGAGLIPADWGQWVAFGLAIVTAIAVYQVPNAKTAE
jgi:phage tail protein X